MPANWIMSNEKISSYVLAGNLASKMKLTKNTASLPPSVHVDLIRCSFSICNNIEQCNSLEDSSFKYLKRSGESKIQADNLVKGSEQKNCYGIWSQIDSLENDEIFERADRNSHFTH